MLTVQMMIGSVEADTRNGSSQRRYQGNTTGANKRDAAMGQTNMGQEKMGQTNTSEDDLGTARLLSQLAVANPTSTASPASNGGGATLSRIANTGPLKRKPRRYAPSEPTGMRP